MMLYHNKLRIAGIVEESIVDGPGIRFVIFTQGCKHNCPGCHNPQTHSLDGGKEVLVEDIVEKISENPLLKGVTLSGGEPFLQAQSLVSLIDKLDRKKLNIITYTGYTYEQILEQANDENGFLELLNRTDILIDGRFILDKKREDLKFRGSSNQRAINVKESLKENKIIEYLF